LAIGSHSEHGSDIAVSVSGIREAIRDGLQKNWIDADNEN
jgi:hypothetical protein